MNQFNQAVLGAALGTIIGISLGVLANCGDTKTLRVIGEQGPAGPAGADGIDGVDGADGKPCFIDENYLVCPDGSFFDMLQLTGAPGQPGQGCTVSSVDSCLLVTCYDTSASICMPSGPECKGSCTIPTPQTYAICHMPGTPAEKQLYLPEAALQAHLDHGDIPGDCQ